MIYKLIDIETETEEVEFGTCELCMSIGDLTTDHYVFEDENGVRITVEGGEWDWGEYYYYTHSDINIVDFAAYVSTLDIEDIDREFYNIIQNYEQALKGEQ